ncbi:preprotein translocase subunit SecF [Herbihabitans rhizosphaerae]|uniref:Protein-export membrane protein SecF n=1 Tax=Herbihabitans rhizosphaerae TaxID=1872711 RepID=A0A4Q7KID3_9PSEU|nr:protein translocase subunit SecF [Herbihabitans rhizosphaerae]RZS34344.1 preprotein translocase subunit SecF [Herbihabitans rhizosphaerae]
MTNPSSETAAPAKKSSVFNRLYVGHGAFDIVGKRKRWYVIFGVLILICLASIIFRGFNAGIEFIGGTQVQMPAASTSGEISTDRAKEVYTQVLGDEPVAVQAVGTGGNTTLQIRSVTLDEGQVANLKRALADQLQPNGGAPSISNSAVSASWGGEISTQALIALGVFLVLVTIFLGLYFEKWMAVAALAALIHDVVVTAGVYSIVGFEVTPATVIGLLTILGFSLYDTVVVFDKVKENTRGLLGLTRRTYGEAANLALNQTLIRSINTSLFAVLPVLGLLAIGVGILGVGTLKDLALVQLAGMIAGAVSSIFLATPILVDLKMTESKYKQQAERVHNRRANLARKAAERGESVADDTVESTDDATLDAELRKERAMAAAARAPSRTPKASESKRGKPGAKPTRPSGKRRR